MKKKGQDGQVKGFLFFFFQNKRDLYFKRVSLAAQLVKNPPAMQETPVWFPGLGRSPGEGRLLSPVLLGFPGGSAGTESACSVRDLGSIPGLGRSPGKGKGYRPQYSGLENSMDYKSWTRLSDFHFHTSRSQRQQGECNVEKEGHTYREEKILQEF